MSPGVVTVDAYIQWEFMEGRDSAFDGCEVEEIADRDAVKVKESPGPAGFHASDGGQEDDPAIQAEILHGQ